MSYPAVTPAPKGSDDELSVSTLTGCHRGSSVRHVKKRTADRWLEVCSSNRDLSRGIWTLWSTKVVQYIVSTSQAFQMWSPFNKHCPPQPFPLVLRISTVFERTNNIRWTSWSWLSDLSAKATVQIPPQAPVHRQQVSYLARRGLCVRWPSNMRWSCHRPVGKVVISRLTLLRYYS